jgi:hypothetical protein
MSLFTITYHCDADTVCQWEYGVSEALFENLKDFFLRILVIKTSDHIGVRDFIVSGLQGNELPDY